MTFDVWLPSLPPSLNKRLHWGRRAKINAEVRQSVRIQAQSARAAIRAPKATEPRSLSIEIFRARGVMDLDNAYGSLKACVDGLVDAGALKGDDPAWLTGYAIKQTKRPKLNGVVLSVEVSADPVTTSQTA